MPQALGTKLTDAVSTTLPKLRALPDPERSVERGWGPKEELGHLLDSGANNHLRFVRAALDGHYEGPGYAQNAWVDLHGYVAIPWGQLVDYWASSNHLLANLVANIPEPALASVCVVVDNPPTTLGALIDDYIVHMLHHIVHILAQSDAA